uniref:PRA1 family protein n=1 Tax=Suricata suricatta TaxID=37032 RepID=A0A673VST8_SURSU
MAAEKDQQKDAEPEGLSASTLLPKLIPSGAGREWLERRRATIRPWGSFVDQRRFSRPRNLGELCQRLVRNVEYYQSNYVFVFLGLILYCVPRGEPSPSVRSGRGRLLSLLLAGWCRLCRLLGPGSYPRGHRLPCCLPPDRGGGRGGAADGASVRCLRPRPWSPLPRRALHSWPEASFPSQAQQGIPASEIKLLQVVIQPMLSGVFCGPVWAGVGGAVETAE